MARIIVDASATLEWLFDENIARAELKSLHNESKLVAPWLWRLEVTNAILIRRRRKQLSEAEALQFLFLLDDIPIELISESPTVTALAQLADLHQLTSYDALYLDLAMRFALPLMTLDKNLRAAANCVGVKLLPASI